MQKWMRTEGQGKEDADVSGVNSLVLLLREKKWCCLIIMKMVVEQVAA